MKLELLEAFTRWNEGRLELEKLREKSETIADAMDEVSAAMRKATESASELLWNIGPKPVGVKIGDDYVVATEFEGDIHISSVNFKTREEIIDV
jgi:hypothetical protein